MNNIEEAHSIQIKKIGNKLRELRIGAGYTSYEAFANEHELSRVQYWRMEKGTNFRFSSFLNILDKHKMSPVDFFKQID